MKKDKVEFEQDGTRMFETAPSPSAKAPEREKLMEGDIAALEIAKLNRKVALKEAEKALAQNESAETAFKYIVLQLFMKYGLNTAADAIGDDGKILYGELLKQGAVK